MSFSSEVKDELEKQISTARHCQIAEIAAIISMCGKIHTDKMGDKSIIIHTENAHVARKYFTLVEKTFSIVTDISIRRHAFMKKNYMYTLVITGHSNVLRVLEATKLADFDGAMSEMGFLVNSMLVQSSCCKRAFLRGAFLCSGSVSNPEKSYHFEIVCSNEPKAMYLQALLAAFEIEARIVKRKKYYIVYIKEGRQIVEILNVMEAHVALMQFENVRILKEISGSVNRKVNCETANITKTISAAVEQINDINLIRDTIGLEGLPEGLEEIALARLEAPEATLKELGDSLNPPVGKSGVNHRLRKIKILADAIRENEEDVYAE